MAACSTNFIPCASLNWAVLTGPPFQFAMTETTYPTTNPILGIEDDLPERVHVLCHPDGRHACYCSKGVHCLLGFLTQLEAVKLASDPEIGLGTLTVCSMEIDKALDLAKSKPVPCVALGIWGDGDIARMIYVK